jgi:hypothetical protein
MKLLLLTLAATLALAAPAAAAQDPQLIESDDLSSRLQELTFKTSALAAPTKVRILLPAGYEGSGATRCSTCSTARAATRPRGRARVRARPNS